MDRYGDQYSEPESELRMVTGVAAGIETRLVRRRSRVGRRQECRIWDGWAAGGCVCEMVVVLGSRAAARCMRLAGHDGGRRYLKERSGI